MEFGEYFRHLNGEFFVILVILGYESVKGLFVPHLCQNFQSWWNTGSEVASLLNLSIEEVCVSLSRIIVSDEPVSKTSKLPTSYACVFLILNCPIISRFCSALLA